MKVDFETIAAVISFLVNAAGVTTLALLLNETELVKLADEIKELVKVRLSNYGYVLRKNKLFKGKIFSPLILLLHLINLAIFAALIFILIVGPQNLHAALFSGTIAEPLTLLETIIYIIYVALAFLAYVARCVVPTGRYLSIYRKALVWLKDNEPHKVSK